METFIWIVLAALFAGVYLTLGWLTLTVCYMLKSSTVPNNMPMLIVFFWWMVVIVEGFGLLGKWLDNAAKSLAGWKHD